MRPGFLLAAKGMLALHLALDNLQIKPFLRGKIFRCTGYIKTLEARFSHQLSP